MRDKEIGREKFLAYFGELQEWLRSARKYEEGYFLTGITIRDIPESNQMEVVFIVEYGPVCYRLGRGYEAVINSFGLGVVYDSRGNFAKYSGDTIASLGTGHWVRKIEVPSIKDFPSTMYEELYDIVTGIIAKCSDCGKPLNSISFYTASPVCCGEFSYDNKDPKFLGDVDGICLKGCLRESYKYTCSLLKSTEVQGEYCIVFKVSA